MMLSHLSGASTTQSLSFAPAPSRAHGTGHRHRRFGRWIATAALAIAPSAHAAWFVWETVELPMALPSAKCSQ